MNGNADLYVNGQKIGSDVQVETTCTKENQEQRPFSFPRHEGTVTMTSARTNFRLLSAKNRQWCKRLNWNGKTYL